jgi:peptidoglycan/xylan/chitin deacetylase (PgdA/CDA1 family)
VKRKNLKNSAIQTLRLKIATNLVLGVLILSIASLCLSPSLNTVNSQEDVSEIYRKATLESEGVSLMFNVYQGANEVESILQILEKNQAKATFFIGGCWADDNVNTLKAIHEAGHEIGNHGYFHKEHDKLGYQANLQEIKACNQFLELAIGQKITLFAPPSGAYNDATLEACKTLGMKTVLWSKDTIDWRDHDCSLIYTRATKNVQKGDFILMHPTKQTVQALNDVLKYYEKQGLKAVTVSENLKI